VRQSPLGQQLDRPAHGNPHRPGVLVHPPVLIDLLRLFLPQRLDVVERIGLQSRRRRLRPLDPLGEGVARRVLPLLARVEKRVEPHRRRGNRQRDHRQEHRKAHQGRDLGVRCLVADVVLVVCAVFAHAVTRNS
jgi:hypothetical protein